MSCTKPYVSFFVDIFQIFVVYWNKYSRGLHIDDYILMSWISACAGFLQQFSNSNHDFVNVIGTRVFIT